MAEFKQDQMMMWVIYQNLRHDSAAFKPTDIEPTNSAQELLGGLLNNQTFRDAIKSIATSLQRIDIVKAVETTPIQPGARDTLANTIVEAAVAGDKDMVADLAKTPGTTINSLEELNQFWNAEALISQNDPETHTHIMADPRYVKAFDAYVAANEMSGDAATKLRAEIVAKHEAAVQTLDTIEYDGLQMQYAASSDMFYDLSAKGDFAALGYTETAPSTIFTGLKIAEPMTATELTSVTAPMPHIAIQEAKDEAAGKPTVIEPAPVEKEPIDPSTLTKEQIVAGLKDLQANDATVTLDTYKQGFVLLNPAYENFFEAVDASGGVLVNPLQDQLTKALNENPDVLTSMIELSGDTTKIEALTASIGTEGGSTDLVLALAKANGEAPYSINPHAATPLEGPAIPTVEEVINNPALSTPPQVVVPEDAPSKIELPNDDVTPGPVFNPAETMSLSGVFVSSAAAATLTDPEAGARIVNDSIPPSLKQHFSDMTGAEYTTLAEEPAVEPEKAASTTYTVQRGDSLWKIAKEQYGLTSYKDIMRATDHIAQANGLEKGTDANWIKIGADINMPTAEQIQQPANSLDWKALDEDPKLGAAARTSTMALTN